MEENAEKPKAKKQETKKRLLNQDLIDQCPGLGPRPRRGPQMNPSMDRLIDKHKGLGDILTPQCGYDIFMYHYRKQFKSQPVYNPWRLNLGRLMVPNVFINVDLIKALASRYDPKRRTI